MIIDRERVKNTFAEYTSGYNATDPKIKLKIDHTYRVAELCELNRNMMLSIDVVPVPTDEAVREVENRLLGVETNITNWQRKQNQNNLYSRNICKKQKLFLCLEFLHCGIWTVNSGFILGGLIPGTYCHIPGTF